MGQATGGPVPASPRLYGRSLTIQYADHAGVNGHALQRGFEKACERAGIPFGLTVEGGLIWHDLRRTFATELRARQVHEYDIADLLGHTIQAVTGTYAQSTPEALEDAVNRLRAERQCDQVQKEG